MKRIFTILSALCAVMALWAAENTATLSHNGAIQQYQGEDALQRAYNDAVDGDAIFLSVGTFSSTEIKKSITLRGAGMGVVVGESITDSNVTKIVGDTNIEITNQSDELSLTIEDIYFESSVWIATTYNTYFNNCTFMGQLDERDNDWPGLHCTFYGCYADNFQLATEGNDMLFCNCVIKAVVDSGYFYFLNCVVQTCSHPHGYDTYMANPTFKNSIYIALIYDDDEYAIPDLNIENSLVVTKLIDKDSMTLTGELYEATSLDGIFADDTFYVLTDEAAAKYLGTDGTQIGAYGGDNPFDASPVSPRIAALTTDGETDADGILSVTLEIQ
ncbi:MAG: hypothetical protein LIP03_13525 [Bacteroidales bacterium]|nr:hypothetical protein [Bacteroidales bacterium]